MSAAEGRPPTRGRLTLLALAFLSLTFFIALLATGGFQTTVFGLRVSARSPLLAGAVALLAFAAWLVAARQSDAIESELTSVSNWIERHAHAIVLTIAVVSAAATIRFGSFSAGGSDASGYFSQAAMLADGRLTRDEPFAATAEWPDAPSTLAPLGWRAGVGTTQVPTYAVGLPLLMAVPHALGGPIGASLVVSVSAALAVWFTGQIAMLLAGGAAGVLAAAWLATMPVFLFESIQPMSDVPVTAAWLAVWWCIANSAALRPAQGRPEQRRGAEKGPAFAAEGRYGEVSPKLATASRASGGGTVPLIAVSAIAAVLIRPNLAPLAAIPLLLLMMRVWRGEREWRPATTAFAISAAFAGLAIAYLQWRYFGSPFRSGYGSASEIYALANLSPNASLYLTWLLDTHGPWLLLAPAVLVVRREPLVRWMLAFAALVCLAYLVYSVFEHWSYLRFLLPAMAIAAIAVSVFVATLALRLPVAASVPLVIAISLAIAAWQVSTARTLDVFRFAARQSRAMLAGRYLASALPVNAVVIAGEQSGAVRYYSGRSIVRWDFLKPPDLELITNELNAKGSEIWIALDDWEVPRYREKFPQSVGAGLDWPPILDAGTAGRTQAWRLRDRPNFMNGMDMVTDRLR